MKLLVCFGTRPEAIKMAQLVHELKKCDGLNVQLCITAQHREMLDQVLDFFELLPDFDLNLMKPNQTLNEISSIILDKIDVVLQEAKPDIVMVHGDTTTSFICSLAAFHRNIKVAHIEAGLRTYNKYSPFPEEVNRQLTSRIAEYHFAPTENSSQNLLNENVSNENVLITGNTVIDALFWTVEKIRNGYTNVSIEFLKSKIDFKKKIILVTGHRRENFGNAFREVCLALLELAQTEDVLIVYPVHLNPNIQKPVNEILGNVSNVLLINALDYPSFVWLMEKSYIIITDSGGIQEEAPSLGKPVLVTRNTTERPEAIEQGTVLLVGTNSQTIVSAAKRLINSSEFYLEMANAHNPYGDGKAVAKIVDFLHEKSKYYNN